MSEPTDIPSRRTTRVLLALTLLIIPSLGRAQVPDVSSWIVYIDTSADLKEASESILRSLPEEVTTSGLRPLFSAEETPRATSAYADRLSRYYVLECTGGRTTPPSDIPGVLVYPNHRYAIERHDGEDLHDPFIEQQWGLRAIGAERAWELTRGEASVVIGYIDTGIEFDHPELAPNLYINPREDVNGNGRFDPWAAGEVRDGVRGDLDGIDQDGNGYVDDVSGYDFVDQVIANLGDWEGRDAFAGDEQGHGTLVAGVASAQGGNNRGVSGVAPNCRILPLRAFDATGDGEDDDIAAAIIYAADQGVDVLNLSFGDYYRSPLLADAIRYAAERDVLLVASSGNDGIDDAHYPSGFSEVMSIGAMRRDSLLSLFSGFGSHISLVAPGEEILTTSLAGGYRTVDGTSFAAPHVSGVAALMRSARPDLSAAELRYAIEYAASDLGERGWDIDFGAGLLDAYRSLGAPAGGLLRIDSPSNDSGIVREGSIRVVGSVIGVGISSWNLSWGAGVTPTEWDPISEGRSGILSGTLGTIDTGVLPTGIVTLALSARFTDGTSNERRVSLYVDDTAPVISNVRVDPIWVGEEEGYVVTCTTDDRSTAILELEAPDGRLLEFSPEEGRTGLTRRHYWIVRPNELSGNRFERAVIRARNPAGLHGVTEPFELPVHSRGASASLFRSRESLPYGYLYSADSFAFDDRRFLLLNRFEDLTFSRTILYRVEESGPVAVDSIGNYVPRGIGDTDGDGLLEALLQSTGTGVVTEQSTQDGTLFATTLFADSTSGAFYPGAFIDVDRDGRDEIVGYTKDTQTGEELVGVWKLDGGVLELVSSASNPTGFPRLAQKNSFGASDVAHRDIDGDGYPEILVGDSDGDVLLFSWVPGPGLVQRWIGENEGVDADKIFTIVDLEGDGRPEVIYGFQAEPGRDELNEYDPPIWSLQGIGFDDDWRPTEVLTERFAWPRPVSTFRSGVDAGNLDSRDGEELVLVLFPHSWVFTWDPLEKRLRPLWSRSGSMINDPSVSTGLRGERAGFWVGDGTLARYYTIDSSSLSGVVPPVLSGWSTGDSTALLEWSESIGSESFRIYREDPEGEPGRFSLIAETEDRIFSDSGVGLPDGRLMEGADYRYLVVAVSGDGQAGLPSNVITITPHAKVRPISVTGISPRQFILSFSGSLPERLLRAGSIQITGSGEGAVTVSTLVSAGDSSVLATLLEPMPGVRLRIRATETMRDRSGAPVDTSVILSVTMPEAEIAPRFWVSGAEPGVGSEIRLSFSAVVDPSSLSDAIFTIDPPGTISGVRVSNGSDSVLVLDLADDYPLGPYGYTYTIRSFGVRSSDGAELPDGPGSIAGFTIAAESLDQLDVYPQPFSYHEDDRLTFRGLPITGTVEVYTILGRILVALPISRGDGATEWDGLDRQGRQLPSGVYLFRVVWTGPGGSTLETALRKLVLVE